MRRLVPLLLAGAILCAAALSAQGGTVFVVRRAAGWTPSDLPGIVDWMVASDAVVDGEGVNRLDGKLGDIIVTQTTAAQKPAYNATGSPNGLPSFGLSGSRLATSNPGGQFTSSPVAQPYTVAALYRSTDTAGTRYVLDSTSGSNRGGFGHFSSKWFMFAGSTFQPATATNGAWRRAIITFNGASSQIELDGVSLGTGNAGAHSLSGLSLFTNASASGNWSGDWVAYVLVSGTISAADKTELLTWMAAQ